MNRFIITVACLCVGLSVAAPSFAKDYHHKFKDYKGYKKHPYDRKRHYDHHEHHDHRYAYRGHWRSWLEWDHYLRQHPELHRHGRYYHDGVHLMFRTCDPGTNTCIFFSIGR